MEKKRRLVQSLSLLLSNIYLNPFRDYPIYAGNLKYLCFPGLVCYSCPFSLFSCPLGGLQHALTLLRLNLSLGIFHTGTYVAGFLGMVGSTLGRAPCGWLCPFGFLQELLYRLPTRKYPIPKILSHLPKIILLALLILPILFVDESGIGDTYFCKYLCPAGMIQAGLPLMIIEKELRNLVGALFFYKTTITTLITIWCIFSIRAFCRVLCPLGVIFGLFNRISMLRLVFHKENCVECKACLRICPSKVSFYNSEDDINSIKCIRCLKCYTICPTHSINIEFKLVRKVQDANSPCNSQ